jgi:hypothetical protein
MAVAAVVVAATVPTVSAALTSAGSGDCTIAAAGDIAESGGDQQQTAGVVQSLNPDAVLTLGDNAYPSGSSSDFASYYDPSWGRFASITKPAVGNHEYETAGAQGYFDYFKVAPYYSYDLCGWHLYSLNREIAGSERDAELSWLRADLAAHAGQPMLAVWHEPRWSSGTTHGSDEGAADLWNAVVAGGARVVLTGHEHLYERFAELDADGRRHPGGTREFVVGEGGTNNLYAFGAPLDTSEKQVQGQHGVLAMTLRPDGYDWRLVQVGGAIADQGTQQFAGAATPGASSAPVLAPAPPGSASPSASAAPPPEASSPPAPSPPAPSPPAPSPPAPSPPAPSPPAPSPPAPSPPAPSPPAPPVSSLLPQPGPVNYWWLRASQAASVQGTAPDRNFGTAPELLAGTPAPGRSMAFLRFDLSVVPAGASVVHGLLYLRATTDLLQPVDVYTAPSTWSQGTLTWANRPAFWPEWVGRIPPARAGEWVSLDVSGLLHAGTPVSLVLTTASQPGYTATPPASESARFASDETSTPPTLYLSLTGTRQGGP